MIEDAKVKVKVLTHGQLIRTLGVATGLNLITIILLTTFTDSQYVLLDSGIAVLSVIATFLLSRKIINAWYFWIIVNILGIGLFTLVGLYWSAGLYLVFLFLNFKGLTTWQKDMVKV